MGLCSELIISKEVTDIKRAKWREREENKGWGWDEIKEEGRRVGRATEEIKIEWRNAKKYLATKGIRESLNIKTVKIIGGWKIKKIDWEG